MGFQGMKGQRWKATIPAGIVAAFLIITSVTYLDSPGNSIAHASSSIQAECSSSVRILDFKQDAGPTIFIQNAQIASGESISLPLALNQAPEGLSGFKIEVRSESPSSLQINSVAFPNFGLTKQSISLPYGPSRTSSVRMAAVDLRRLAEPGATDITLGTIGMRGTFPGTSRILIRVFAMDDDEGFPIDPVVILGSVTIC